MIENVFFCLEGSGQIFEGGLNSVDSFVGVDGLLILMIPRDRLGF